MITLPVQLSLPHNPKSMIEYPTDFSLRLLRFNTTGYSRKASTNNRWNVVVLLQYRLLSRQSVDIRRIVFRTRFFSLLITS